MINQLKACCSLLLLVTFSGCFNNPKNNDVTVKVSNHLGFARKEVVSVKADQLLPFFNSENFRHLKIKKENSETYLITQWIDVNQDGVVDELLF